MTEHPRPKGLAVIDPKTPLARCCELRRAGLVIAEPTGFPDWEQIGQQLSLLGGAVQWWIGDWLNFGERKWRETYAQAVDATGFDYGTLQNAAWVASCFDFSSRDEKLTFKHHRAIAALPPEYRADFLRQARENNWSTAETFATVRRFKAGSPDWLRIYDVWNFASCDDRFGQDYPGRIPGQIVLNFLHYFTHEGDLVVDPMAGGGTTLDCCKEIGRDCLAFDIEPRRYDILKHDATKPWPPAAQGCAAVFIDPPYFDMKAEDYGPRSVSALPLEVFHEAIAATLRQAMENLASGGRLGLLLSPSAKPALGGFVDHALKLAAMASQQGWILEWRISVPQSSQTINAREVEWTKKEKRMLSLLRDLLVFRKR